MKIRVFELVILLGVFLHQHQSCRSKPASVIIHHRFAGPTQKTETTTLVQNMLEENITQIVNSVSQEQLQRINLSQRLDKLEEKVESLVATKGIINTFYVLMSIEACLILLLMSFLFYRIIKKINKKQIKPTDNMCNPVVFENQENFRNNMELSTKLSNEYLYTNCSNDLYIATKG